MKRMRSLAAAAALLFVATATHAQVTATTSVALNPIIKFSTLFGLLAVEIAVNNRQAAIAHSTLDYTPYVGVVMLMIALTFIWRSFYAMRIPEKA